jgi:hypothetical protein
VFRLQLTQRFANDGSRHTVVLTESVLEKALPGVQHIVENFLAESLNNLLAQRGRALGNRCGRRHEFTLLAK